MLWVLDLYKTFYSCSAGIDFRRQNLTFKVSKGYHYHYLEICDHLGVKISERKQILHPLPPPYIFVLYVPHYDNRHTDLICPAIGNSGISRYPCLPNVLLKFWKCSKFTRLFGDPDIWYKRFFTRNIHEVVANYLPVSPNVRQLKMENSWWIFGENSRTFCERLLTVWRRNSC